MAYLWKWMNLESCSSYGSTINTVRHKRYWTFNVEAYFFCWAITVWVWVADCAYEKFVLCRTGENRWEWSFTVIVKNKGAILCSLPRRLCTLSYSAQIQVCLMQYFKFKNVAIKQTGVSRNKSHQVQGSKTIGSVRVDQSEAIIGPWTKFVFVATLLIR